jgi:hypothetical protein
MYSPNATVNIEGVSYGSQTIANVNITYGKSDPSDTFRPSYATITLVSDENGIDVSILDDVQVYMLATTGNEIVFTGKVSDIQVNLISKDWVETSLTVISPLAKLSSRNVGESGYPEQFDGERFEAIILEASAIPWTEAGGIWTDFIGTWEDLEDFIYSIDTGDKTLASYASGTGAHAFDLLSLAELSGMGHAYETRTGQFGYQAAGARVNDFVNAVDLNADDVIIAGISAESTTGEMRNETAVATHNGNVSTASNTLSIQTYGRVNKEVTTWLKQNTEALQWAERDVALYAFPRTYVSGFSTRLSAVDSTFADVLIKMRMGLPVNVYGLPPAIASNPYRGFVEGWQWNIGKEDAEIQLFISDYALSVVSQEWKNVPSSYAWNNINAALIWKTLEVIS